MAYLFIIEQNVKCPKKDTFGTDGLSDHASDSNFVDNLFKILVSFEKFPWENSIRKNLFEVIIRGLLFRGFKNAIFPLSFSQ